MSRSLRVTMPDGSRWDVPAQVIAENRARYYAEVDPTTTYEEELEFTLSDDYELKDWAAGNMNWSDVVAHARKVSDREPLSASEFQEGWVNGPKQVVDS